MSNRVFVDIRDVEATYVCLSYVLYVLRDTVFTVAPSASHLGRTSCRSLADEKARRALFGLDGSGGGAHVDGLSAARHVAHLQTNLMFWCVGA